MTAKEGVSYFGMMMKVILQKMWITLIGAAHFSCSGTLPEMAAEYRERSCHVDFCYRMFYLAYDKAECMDKFARLRIYTPISIWGGYCRPGARLWRNREL